ncbi:MAG: Pyruvate dehydrogenase component, partial [Hyphomicrobiales bacterium]|nr:Pyruvate dehydrogenase component [Hyphomicrobiales bacterium]
KGHGLPLAGHKDNHAGLMTPTQVETLRKAMNVRPGHEWDLYEGLDVSSDEMRRFLAAAPFAQERVRLHETPVIEVPEALSFPKQATMATQAAFGLIMHEISKLDTDFARRIVTTSPDVTVSTNLGAWVNRRGLFARDAMVDLFRKERIPSTFNWDFSPQGQHLELGIAESNLFIALSALGLSHSIFGERLLPVGTLYDPFIERGLDSLNYACYQDARFMLVATPSGVTLAPEGGAHQSIKTPLIGIGQDGLAAFEPAFADELAVLMRFAFAHMQRSGDATPDPRTSLPDGLGGSSYFRLSTRAIEQPQRVIDADLADDMVAGAYWLRRPGPNAELVVAYQGAVAPEAIAAVGMIADGRRDIGLLAVTSSDRLQAGWHAAQAAREAGRMEASCHIEQLLAPLPRHCGLVSVVDAHPSTLSWLGSVGGHRTRALGVTRFGQTGTIADLYRLFGIDARGIVMAAQAIAPGRRLL